MYTVRYILSDVINQYIQYGTYLATLSTNIYTVRYILSDVIHQYIHSTVHT